jgi:lipopolysaccharide/colanic/teichoic acid biosynthesis glycosyltransferase
VCTSGQHDTMATRPQIDQQQTASPWCNSRGKRMMDIILVIPSLVLTAPLMVLIALGIRSTSRGPVLFRQLRCGLNDGQFQMLKFRTMEYRSAEFGPGVTRRGDLRVTRLGKWLRKWKLDELPQFINVLRGEMSIVGPRPDLEDFWRQATEVERHVLAVKPGLTGAATLAFRNEEEVLAHVPESDLVGFYVRDLLPRKARLDCEYAAQADFLSDCRVVLNTIARILFPSVTHDCPRRKR